MAEHLIMKQKLNHLLPARHMYHGLVSVMMLFSPLSQADTLKDPTQPPAAFMRNAVGADNIETGPVLQSVMIGANYRAAIINGQKVLLGKKYEEATLIKLSEHEAVLRYPDKTTQILTMDYSIEKRTVKPVKPVTANSSKNRLQAK